MIQRIQTLFLTITAGLLISMLFVPMVKFVGSDTVIRYIEYLPTATMLIVTIVLCITTIFSYKRRIFQIRVCNLNSLILLGFQIFLVVKFFTREPDMIYTISAVFPIAGAILTFIAMRYIARDEALVMASNHLRPSKEEKKKKRK